ncbi:MAG: transglycosylase SLT domain-containing protein [Pseudomonadota bacterium]|nr:transglycosylase SLT domain-containing protein [Pseudomonadota bacterium]
MSGDVYEDRRAYKRAVFAIETGRLREFRRLREELGDYVLKPYLDFFEARRRISSIDTSTAARLREQWQETPIEQRFFRLWLKTQAKRGRWSHYLENYEPTRDVEAQCYYLRALYRDGMREEALSKVPTLWKAGASQPKPCDPLFEAWIGSGGISDEIAWERLQLALEANSVTLAKYLLRFFSSSVSGVARAFYDVHVRPAAIRNINRFGDDVYGRQAVLHGLLRYARREPRKAMAMWQRYRTKYTFAGYQVQYIEENLLIELSRIGNDVVPELPRYSAETLEVLADQTTRTGNYPDLVKWIAAMPPSYRETPKWRYWYGKALMDLGDVEGESVLNELANERTYYGFLAALLMNLESALNQAQLPRDSANADAVKSLPGVRRLSELYAVGDLPNARREYLHLFDGLEEKLRPALVLFLVEMGWFNQAVTAANRAELHDFLDVRFPIPFIDTFRRHAFETSIPVPVLLAISRQESVFDTSAISPKGARGIMQLMPKTAQSTAGKIREKAPDLDALMDPLVNIRLGAHYLAELMTRYEANKAVAVAAYNAGPTRVDAWLRRFPGIETVAWIEQIPLQETRSYVKNVLAGCHVYSELLGNPMPVLEAHERLVPLLRD